MATTVYFDLDGTLLNYSTSFAELFAQTLPIEVTTEMSETYSEQVLRNIRNLAGRPYQRAFEAVRDEYDLDVDPEALAAEYVEMEATATRISHAVVSLVESIATRHHTGVLTNGDGRMQRRKIEIHGLDELVDEIIISNEVGARKPDRDIFEEAKKRLPADTFVYVGDTFEEDIVPAREAGFKTVYVGEEDQPNAPVAANTTEELAGVLLPLLSTGSAE
ncbi:HAD family hydrolase [Halorubrum tebenquichense]|uniref:HAD-superfamily hydrolase, subfamily IA, variant 1 n=1 Tax=Halorubrum tebenquichense DSM 14210 TaxID=1227485 RepID=M0DZX3_9EURY|nr:HAD family hydrolase [Halorubrum tebenquichense]ELZ41041.1 HAD-superfamily hydrolase, subfamily IA, variant 1 [Halorubrum tebenquichense DSM 14210]